MKYFIYIFDWTKIKCILFSDYFLIFLNYKYKLFVFFCLFICYFGVFKLNETNWCLF